jgi:hypothetical protein
MSAFDTISNSEAIVLSSEETFSSPTADTRLATTFQGESQPDDDQLAFRSSLERIKVFYGRLSGTAKHSVESQNVDGFGEALHAIASKPSLLDQLYRLRDDEATDILDAIQLVSLISVTLYCNRLLTYAKWLDLISHTHPLHRVAIHMIVKLARESEKLPPSLYVEDITCLDNIPFNRQGGFSDVYQGLAKDGSLLAIKRTRELDSSEAHKVRSCPHPSVTSMLTDA